MDVLDVLDVSHVHERRDMDSESLCSVGVA